MALRDRQQSVQMAEVDSDSDSLGDQIEHFDKVTDEETPMVPR